MPERRIVPDDQVATIEHFLGVLGTPPVGVVHVGGYEGEEVDSYLATGCERVVLVEANPEHAAALRARFAAEPRVTVLEYAVTDAVGTADLHVNASRSGATGASSVLALKRFRDVGTLRETATVSVETISLDVLYDRHGLDPVEHDLLVLDIQGAEGMALRGAAAILPRLRAVLCEVALVELYEDAPLEDEIVRTLKVCGFERLDTLYYELVDVQNARNVAWGDALFVRA